MAPTVQALLDQATAVLPLSETELVQKGITFTASERLVELKRRRAELEAQQHSLATLEATIKTDRVPANDHTRYQDLLEWRAINHEMAALLHLLETL